MINNSILRSIFIISTLIAFGAGIGIYTARQQQAQIPPQIQGMMWPDAKILKPFSTTDQNSEEFGLKDLRGKWSFLFFGYTHCPDICPITLNVFDQVYRKLEVQQKTAPQMIFISVDPVRDNSEQLRNYVNYFNEEFVGLGGSTEQIESLTKQMGIPFFYHEASTDGEYLVDHSSSIFLVSPDNKIVAVFSAPHQPDDILNRFLQIKSFVEGNSMN